MQVPGASSLERAPANPAAHGGSSRAPVPAVSGQMTAHEAPTGTAVLQRLFQGACKKKDAGFSAAKLIGSTTSYTPQRASYVLLLDAETLVNAQTREVFENEHQR